MPFMAKSMSPRFNAEASVGEIELLELDRPADFLFQCLDQIDLEADVLAGVFRVHRDVGRPALGVGRPEQRFLSRRRVVRPG